MWEMVSAVAAVGTFAVITATAVAAVVQLRHLRATNQLNSLLKLLEIEQTDQFEQRMHFVRRELRKKLEDPKYRAGLDAWELIDRTEHPEGHVMVWFEQIGLLVKNGYIDEKVYVDAMAPIVSYMWDLLAPAIAVRRRKVGEIAYENFEFLAARCKSALQTTDSTYPANTARLPLRDPWAHVDGVKKERADQSSAPAS